MSDADGFQLALLGFGAAALAYGALAVRLMLSGYLRPQAGAPASWFLAAVGFSAVWGVAGTAAVWAPGAVGEVSAAAADLLRYAAWFGFLLALLKPGLHESPGGEVRRLPSVAWAACGLAAAALVLPRLIDDERVARAGLFAWLALPVLGLLLVEQLYRNLARDGRWGAKPLCLGLALVFAYDVYIHSQAVLFGSFDLDAFSIRAGIHVLAVPLLFLAARRMSDWQARLQVSHRLAFYSATLLLGGAYLLFVSGIGYYVRFFGGSWGRALQLAVLFGALLVLAVLLMSQTARAKVRVFINKNFFAYRFDYREEWLRFTNTLSAAVSPQEMGALVIRGLADMVESPGGSLWMRSADGSRFVETARTHRVVPADQEAADSAFVRFMAAEGWIVDLDEARQHPQRYPGMTLPAWLPPGGAVWAAVPLMVGEEMTGFALIAPPHAGAALDWEVRDLLKTASRQAAAFLAQLHAAEALLEARKFEAFNRMSAFVVHDLKNIVTQLSLMMKNAKRLHDNPEFQQDMLATVESSLDKMRQLMLQLRAGQAAPGGTAGVELAPIAKRLVDAAAQRGRTLELERVEPVNTRGDAARIERVLGHVVQNAFDATPDSGRVWLSVARVSGQVHVVVGDTGLGMTRDFIENRLFKPFASTKTATSAGVSGGMGIGSFESFQYVRELGGQILVDSEPGRGTVFTLVLPLLQTTTGSDLQMTAPA
ncbi:XrtA/PEP-CTERM system histidine kinase PrsK [Rubrivivax albus]|uniref:histidine kinase n=1 Tax=Rubrivivax albus TaxID=2499835 RepID=A0A437JZA6_9BURK|nr:XrtA/PEP-CTERM system histidine kinase PrsK [Rubrivivax albus]RVT53428.1 PEP-CTERM system histidine kinase PrsK [Rubrivivax albus]